jgi:hypothetical protein
MYMTQNLGTLERIVRLALAVLLAIWVSSEPALGLPEWLAVIMAVCLTLNALSGRCYLWCWLKLNTRRCDDNRCDRRKSCS